VIDETPAAQSSIDGRPDPKNRLDDTERLESLAEIGLDATPDATLDRFAELVRMTLGVPIALVSLVDDKRQFFPGQSGLPAPVARERQTPLSHSFCRHVVVDRTPLIVTDARQDPRVQNNLAIPEIGVIGYAGMPLTDTSGRVLGSLCAIDVEPHAWTPSEVAMLQGLAEACTAALRQRESAHKARVAQRDSEVAAGRLTLLLDVARALAEPLDEPAALARVAQRLIPELADWSLLAAVSPAGVVASATGAHREPASAAMMEKLVDGFAAGTTVRPDVWHQLRSGEPVLSVETDGRWATGRVPGPLADLFVHLRARSVLSVPIRTPRDTIGFLSLGRTKREPFDPEDIPPVTDIGRRVGLAVAGIRAREQQYHTVEVLQRSMLTEVPHLTDLDLAARYVPAAEYDRVGGDWYDAFAQPDGSVTLVIGDVVGHDIAAAAAMGQLRNIFRGIAYDSDEPLADVLRRVDTVCTGLGLGVLATALVARVDPRPDPSGGRWVRWSNAGHLPPVMLRADGSVDLLVRPPGLLLGVAPDAHRGNEQAILGPGETLLLFTDGLVERRGSLLDDDLDRLLDAASGLADRALGEICDTLVGMHLSGRADDDVALLAVRLR
jgi:GAF domain-containing protein